MSAKTLVIFVMMGTLASPVFGTLVVDQFDAPAGGLLLADAPGGGSASALTLDAGILGGSRIVQLTASGSAGLNAETSINLAPNGLAIANDPGVSSITALRYDGNGGGLGDVDLIGLGLGRLEFDLDLGDFPSTLTAQLHDGATVSEVSVPLPIAPPTSVISIPFAAFTTVGPGDPFTSLDAIVMTIDALASADIVLGGVSFVAIPEASGFLLLSLASGAALAASRSRRRA